MIGLSRTLWSMDDIVAPIASLLATAPYVPQTDSFKNVATANARDFVAAPNSIKVALAALGLLAQAIDKILTYMKRGVILTSIQAMLPTRCRIATEKSIASANPSAAAPSPNSIA